MSEEIDMNGELFALLKSFERSDRDGAANRLKNLMAGLDNGKLATVVTKQEYKPVAADFRVFICDTAAKLSVEGEDLGDGFTIQLHVGDEDEDECEPDDDKAVQ